MGDADIQVVASIFDKCANANDANEQCVGTNPQRISDPYIAVRQGPPREGRSVMLRKEEPRSMSQPRAPSQLSLTPYILQNILWLYLNSSHDDYNNIIGFDPYLPW